MDQEEEEEPLLISCPQEQEGSESWSLIRLTWLESKKIWQIAGPSIFSRLAMVSVTVTVQSFAGHLSDLDLAAISVASTVIISITFGFLVTWSPLLCVSLFLGSMSASSRICNSWLKLIDF